MEEIIQSIMYGSLPIDLPSVLTEKEQLEIVRTIVVSPHALLRLKLAESHLVLKRYIDLLKIS